MAINNTINASLLTYITKGEPTLTTGYSSGIYIGLLTTLPTDADDMTAQNPDWKEVDFNLEDPSNPNHYVSTGYGRYPLSYTQLEGQPQQTKYYYSKGAHSKRVIQSQPSWNSNDKACIIVNDGDDMMFPNIIDTLHEKFPDKSWSVKGFGLFSAATSGVMIAYGKLVDKNGNDLNDGVNLTQGSVPIFYQNSFKLMLKDGDTSDANNETPEVEENN